MGCGHREESRRSALSMMIAFCVLGLLAVSAAAQNAELQQRVNELKEAAARNKRALAQYRWQQQETIRVKGKVKKQDLFQVEPGPEGKPLRVPIAQDESSSSSERQHGLKQKMGQRKTEEMEQYAREIKDLAQSYAPPDPDRLQQAYQQGNVSLAAGGSPGEVRLVIRDYAKPGDSVTFNLDQAQKELRSMDVSSYLSSSQDVVKLSAQFDRLPDGTGYMSEMQAIGVRKQLTVSIKNFDYRRM